MPGTVEFIESYFQQTLSSEERAAFELRCTTDEVFAEEVAFYIATRQAMREELLMQKVKAWKTDDNDEAKNAHAITEESTPVISMRKKPGIIRWVSYAAAACLILIVAMFLFERQGAPERLAASYINTNYETLSNLMGGPDSIQTGIAAYKVKRYDSALVYFKDIESREPENSDIKKYAGLCYLQQKDYDNALKEFDALAAMDLRINSGNILKAVTLLERNNTGDKEEAKKILKIVVDEKLDGSEEAAEWLRKL
jgi:tetratricopeptide (TPR) repeat protein